MSEETVFRVVTAGCKHKAWGSFTPEGVVSSKERLATSSAEFAHQDSFSQVQLSELTLKLIRNKLVFIIRAMLVARPRIVVDNRQFR